jgi:peptidyl-prolyl cis-trans isomerase SurA
MPGGKQGFRLLYLKIRTEPHRANLKDDYQRIQEAAQNEKQQQLVNKWIEKKLAVTYYRINQEYNTCTFENFRVQAP